MTRNNGFSSLDCWGLWKELVVLSYSVLAVISAGFSLPDVQSDVLFPSCMHTTVFSIYQQLRQFVICLLMSLMHCIRSLVSRMCRVRLLQCTHIPASVAKFCSRPGFRVNQTVWWTQIWIDKIQCFLLKEMDYFTSIE